MKIIDEPVLGISAVTGAGHNIDHTELQERIRSLVAGQPYAVLCTQGGGQPYGSLVAFAATQDLKTMVFATPVTTRKFRLLTECDRVALLIDNRSSHISDITQFEAVTATGRATMIELRSDVEPWMKLLSDRHAYMKAFLDAQTTALFRVEIVRYLHVVRFQEVNEWIPHRSG